MGHYVVNLGIVRTGSAKASGDIIASHIIKHGGLHGCARNSGQKRSFRILITKSKWTIKELKKYQWASLFRMHKVYVSFVVILEILLLAAALAAHHYGYSTLAIESVVFAFLLPLGIYLITIFRVYRNYSSSKLLQNTVTTFKFDEDRFEASTDMGSSVMLYDDLYRIIETKTNFYFFMSNTQALTVIKENCSPELISFLHGLTLKK